MHSYSEGHPLMKKKFLLSLLFYISAYVFSLSLGKISEAQKLAILRKFSTKGKYRIVDISFCDGATELDSDKCGYPTGALLKPLPGARIRDGLSTNPFSYPFLATIFKRYGFLCAGTIISNRLVLSAAHCFYPIERVELYWIVTGVHNIFEPNRQERGYAVNYIARHENSGMHKSQFDIAILRTVQNIERTCYARKACLPYDVPLSDQFCSTMGWGETSANGDKAKELLRTFDIIRSDEYCKARMGMIGRDSQFLCGGRQNNLCEGDDGGPLLCVHNKRMYVKGIINFQNNCGNNGVGLNVYTNVSYFMPWIKKTARYLGDPVPEINEMGS